MQDGKIQQYDTPANVYHRPASTFVATFVGSPSMNLIDRGDRTLAFGRRTSNFAIDRASRMDRGACVRH